MSSSCAEVLRGYGEEGRRPAQEVLELCQSYRGPEPHFMWAECWNELRVGHYGAAINYCLRCFPEERLYELFRALVDGNPEFPRIRDREGKSFLDVALNYAGRHPVPSGRTLVLLAVPGTTRSSNVLGRHPLHIACSVPGVDAAFINHLINLDPDVLMKGRNEIPLHDALVVNPTGAFISPMVEVRPESLLWTKGTLGTPVAAALRRTEPSPAVARVLLKFVLQCPGSVTAPTGDSLMCACRRFHEYPELIKAIVQADPSALGVASLHGENQALFPFQLVVTTANATTRDFVEKETVEVALAVVEHVLGAVYAPKRGVYELSHLALFRRHVWRMMATYLGPDERPIGTSGFAVAQALRKLDKRRRMDLCQDLFCGHERSRRLLIGWQMSYRENQLFRDAVLGKGVTGLYRLNRRDRSKASWAHQVRLLESVNDNLDCIFLHFRAVVCEILIW